MTDCEIWKDIVGYEGIYQVSNMGQVKSVGYGKERILKQPANRGGYFIVRLCKDKKQKNYLVSRLVGFAFLDTVDGCPEIDHINRVRTDNRVSNLRWADAFTQAQNKDWILNAKHICIFYSNCTRMVSRWTVQWRYVGGKVKTKSFMTKDLAQAFVDTLDKSRLIQLHDSRKSKSKSV